MPQESSKRDRDRVRHPARLKSKLDKNLISYALAATAAGVGVLAAPEPAEARIIATRTNITIPMNGGIIPFDVNGDGIADFGLSARIYEFAGAAAPPMGNFSSSLRVIPEQAGNEVWGVSSHKDQCAAAVRAGLSVDQARPFKPGPLIMVEAAGSYTRGRSSHCPWHGAHPPYLGLKFMINGEIHYGWARVMTAVRTAVLTGFAYETIPNKPITAGAVKGADGGDVAGSNDLLSAPPVNTSSLGTLALGWQGIEAWKRPEDENLERTS